MLGFCIPDITKRLTSLVGTDDYHPFLLYFVGSNEVALGRLKYQKGLYVPQKYIEGRGSADSVLLYPSSWRTGHKKKTNGSDV